MSAWLKQAFVIFIVVGTTSANAIENRCNRNVPIGNTQSICNGRTLPLEQTRGRSNSHLTCNGNVDNYIRRPQEIADYAKWADALTSEGPKSKTAFQLRQQMPPIAWNGRIPYTVTEEWNWIECSADTNGSVCGTDRECHNVDASYESCSTSKDRDGNSTQHCHTVHQTKQECEDIPRQCYYDHPRQASQYCSDEVMTYTAGFERDRNWTPASADYNDFIANKYDLLPGEVEAVQVFSNSNGGGTRLNPSVTVGDAWNKYSFRLGGSAPGAICRQNANETLTVAIVTDGRIKKASPNAFRLPVKIDGSPIKPLVWVQDVQANVKAYPKTLRMSDTSANLVSLVARQSRENADREIQKDGMGLGGNPDAQPMKGKPAALDPFFKNTQVQIQLMEAGSFTTSAFSPAFNLGDGLAVQSANLSLSELQSIRNSEYWVIPLDGSSFPQANIYKRQGWMASLFGTTESHHLKPGGRYVLQISMYQKGMPFYIQSCEDGGTANCSSSKNAFSKPLEVPFRTNVNYENRSFMERLSQYTIMDSWHRSGARPQSGDDDANVSETRGGGH